MIVMCIDMTIVIIIIIAIGERSSKGHFQSGQLLQETLKTFSLLSIDLDSDADTKWQWCSGGRADRIASEIFGEIVVSRIFVKEQQAAEQKNERPLPEISANMPKAAPTISFHFTSCIRRHPKVMNIIYGWPPIKLLNETPRHSQTCHMRGGADVNSGSFDFPPFSFGFLSELLQGMEAMHIWGHFRIFLAFPGRRPLTIWLMRLDWQPSLNGDASCEKKIGISAFSVQPFSVVKSWCLEKSEQMPCSPPFNIRVDTMNANGFNHIQSSIYFLDPTIRINFGCSTSKYTFDKVFNLSSSFV